MRFSVTGLIRCVTLLFIASSAAAIGVARLTPEGRSWRMPSTNSYVNVPANLLGLNNEYTHWLDVNRGEMRTVTLPAGDSLLYSSNSPWVDEKGHSEAVGLWAHFEGECRALGDMGLGRVSFPDGEVLDVVRTQSLPTSVPAWYPGTGSRILYSAGDGFLYHYDFRKTSQRLDVMSAPEQIRWSCGIPNGGVVIADPHFVKDSRVDQVVLVSLREREFANGRPRLGHARIWWLRLSENGREIVEAGRVSTSPAGPGNDLEERYPTVGQDESGHMMIAYQRRVAGESWEVYLAPFSVNQETRRPAPMARQGRKVAEQCQPLPVVFSSDGRWIGVVGVGNERDATPRRISIEMPIDLVSIPPRDALFPR